jgi:HSP20 family protein
MLTRRTEWADWPSFGFSEFGPFSALEQLRRDVDRAFSEVARGRVAGRMGHPHFSLEDAGDKFVLQAELPGMSEKDIEISVTANSVTLRGQRKANPPEGHTVHRKERRDFEFARSFTLPVRVDADKAEATMKHGVLKLALPKAPEAQPRQIAVKSS